MRRDKKAEDVDGNWTLLSGVIATDSAMASNNRLYNIKLQNVLMSSIIFRKYQKPSILSTSLIYHPFHNNQISKLSYSIFDCKGLRCQIEVIGDKMEKWFALPALQTHLTPAR